METKEGRGGAIDWRAQYSLDGTPIDNRGSATATLGADGKILEHVDTYDKKAVIKQMYPGLTGLAIANLAPGLVERGANKKLDAFIERHNLGPDLFDKTPEQIDEIMTNEAEHRANVGSGRIRSWTRR